MTKLKNISHSCNFLRKKMQTLQITFLNEKIVNPISITIFLDGKIENPLSIIIFGRKNYKPSLNYNLWTKILQTISTNYF